MALRRLILAAQSGSSPDCEALLHCADARWRQRFGAEAPVGTALFMILTLRQTYHPRRCPRRWVDGVLSSADRAVTRAAAAAKTSLNA